MPTFVTKLSMAALLAVASAPALAAPGNGIRLGGSEGRLHPYLELEGRYDSNVYVGAANQDVSDIIIHVRPGLNLNVPGETTSVELGAKLDFAEYLGNDDPATKDLSKVYAEAELSIGVNGKGAVALEVNDTFRRSDRPQALALYSGLISNFNLLELKVPWRPGGGALTLSASGAWALETFESHFKGFSCDPAVNAFCDMSKVSKLGYSNLTAGAGLAWKFLPRTSAILEGTYFKRLPNDTALTNTKDPGGYRVQAGVSGLVTPRIATTLKAGYGSTTGVSPTLGTWLATVEGEWIPSETGSVKLGFAHDLAVDPVVLYTTNRISLSARQLVAGRFALGLTGSWDMLGYTGAWTGDTTILQVSPSVGAEITRWLKAELAYAYTDRSSTTGAVAAVRDYTKNEIWLKVAATY